MSVYVVTTAGVVVEYGSINPGSRVWIGHEASSTYRVYEVVCRCCDDQIMHRKAPHTGDHENLIAWVNKSTISSIGFNPPVVSIPRISGLLHSGDLKALLDWLERGQESGRVPKKLEVAPLRRLVG